MSYTNPSSPMDYTNKDFRAVFPELLDLVKQLTSKWDPSISNESDPGVILMKLNAIIADKNNYNIDKNILEAFPDTLTQEVSARRLYGQLGYNMNWYRSSETDLTFKYVGNMSELPESGWRMRIPKYTTMITDEDATTVYTLMDDVELTREEPISSGHAVEGVFTTVKVAGSEKLTYSNLDDKRRLYFDDYNVPQNCILVTSYTGSGVTNTWSRVDNLATIAAYDTQYYFEFGVDPQTQQCYIEFPRNAADLIGAYFKVSYTLSSGTLGRVIANTLTTYYNDTTVYTTSGVASSETEEVLETSKVVVNNFSASTAGYDPETIEEANVGYRARLGTFDTLITVRDYLNAVLTSGIVSNGVVADRYTDLQTAYTVVVPSDTDYAVRRVPNGEMNAYDLKLYLIGNNEQVYDVASFNRSFDVSTGLSRRSKVINYLEDSKAISHNYVDYSSELLQEGITNITAPVLFTNYYSLRIRYIPKRVLKANEQVSVRTNIITSLLQNLNAHKVQFGTALDYNTLVSWIQNSDSRIQTVILEDPTYTTYATYYAKDGSVEKLKRIPISDFSNDPRIIEYSTSNTTGTPLMGTGDDPYKDLQNKSEYFFVNSLSQNMFIWKDSKYTLYASGLELKQLRRFIWAKNVFKGVTPPFVASDSFEYSLNKKVDTEATQIDRISTSLSITIPSGESYTLRDNETIRILGPQVAEKQSYSSGVKFCLQIGDLEGSNLVSNVGEDITYDQFSSSMTSNGYSGANIYINTLTVPNTNNSLNGGQSPINLADIGAVDNAKPITIDGVACYDITDFLKAGYKGFPGDTNAETRILQYNEVLKAWSNNDARFMTLRQVISLQAGSIYQLREGDAIIFFTQEEDGDYAPYVYYKYTGTGDLTSPILEPSYHLTFDAVPESLLQPSKFPGTQGTVVYGSSTYLKLDTTFEKYCLTGTNSITMCELAQATYTEGSFYFITNTTMTDDGVEYYELALPQGEVKSYILDTDEYFIHITANKQAYEVLGPGTRITFPSNLQISTMKVEKVPYTLVLNNGLSAFLDLAKPVKDYGSIQVRQQQINNFAAGDTILWNSAKDTDLELGTNVYTPISSDEIAGLYYTTVDGSRGSLSRLALNVAAAEDLDWQAKAVLNVATSKYESMTLQNFSSNNSEKAVTVTQSIQLHYSDGTNSEPIQPSAENPVLQVVSSYPISKVGGSNIDVSYTFLDDGSSMPVDIQVFTQDAADSSLQDWVITVDSGPQVDSTYEGIWSVPTDLARSAGGYIIPFELSADIPEGLIVNLSGALTNVDPAYACALPIQGTLATVQNTSVYTYVVPNGKSTFYLLYAGTAEAGQYPDKLRIQAIAQGTSDKSAILKLTPKPFKYYELTKGSLGEAVLSTYFSEVLSVPAAVSLLHEASQATFSEAGTSAATVYQWDYQTGDGAIYDPLDSSSFFNTLHACNKYCIPQLRANFNNVATKNISESLIQVVNNK